MEISGYGFIQQNDATSETERLRRQRQASGWDLQSGDGKGDTVSFSPEAMRLAAQMQAAKTEASETSPALSDKLTRVADSGSGKGATTAANAGAVAGASDETVEGGENAEGGSGSGGAGGAGGAGGSSSGEDVSSIESKIKALTSQLQSVLSGAGPQEVKQSKANAIQTQISELQQQLNELKAQAAKS